MPDNAVTVTSSGTLIRYQGYAGKILLSNIKFNSNAGQDPLDSTYYTYTTNALQTKIQLLAYLEDGGTISLDYLHPLSAYADPSDYSKRFALVMGHSLGVLVSSGTLVPIQVTGAGIDVSLTGTGYTLYVARGDTRSGNNTILSAMTGTGVSSTGSTAINYCGTSSGQTVGAPSIATFTSNLCTGGATVSVWSGTGGANSTLSWTCQNASNTSNCTATYNKFTTTTTPTMVGAACDTYDLLIGSLTSGYQVWSACNVGASIAYMGTTITNCGGASDCDSGIRNTRGYYFQWGRNDDVTPGAFQGSAYNGTLTANSTSNQLFYS